MAGLRARRQIIRAYPVGRAGGAFFGQPSGEPWAAASAGRSTPAGTTPDVARLADYRAGAEPGRWTETDLAGLPEVTEEDRTRTGVWWQRSRLRSSAGRGGRGCRPSPGSGGPGRAARGRPPSRRGPECGSPVPGG